MENSELRNMAEDYFQSNKRVFTGINGGEYIDKEDWDKFFDTLSSPASIEVKDECKGMSFEDAITLPRKLNKYK